MLKRKLQTIFISAITILTLSANATVYAADANVADSSAPAVTAETNNEIKPQTDAEETPSDTDSTASAESDFAVSDDFETEQRNTDKTPKKDVRNSLLRIETVYEFNDGSSVKWTEGYGFLISKDCMVVSRNAAIIEQDTQLYRNIVAKFNEQFMEQVGVDLRDFQSARENIHTYVMNGNEKIEAFVNTEAGGDSFAILNLSSRINSKETVVLSDGTLSEGEQVYAIGSEVELTDEYKERVRTDFYGRLSTISGIRKNGTSEYVEFEGPFADLLPGCPLVDANQVVVGMITDGNAGKGSAVDIKTIENSLDTANIEYSVVKADDTSQQPSSTDENKGTPTPSSQDQPYSLDELIAQATSIDRTQYTEESLKELDNATASAQAILSEPNASKNRLDKAATILKAALDNLQPIDKSGKYVRLALLLVILVLMVLAILFIPKFIANRGKEEWQLEEEREAKKQAKLEKKAKDKKDKKPLLKKKKKDDEWDNGNDDTGVLTDDGATGVLNDSTSRAWLVSSKDGSRIAITKNSFVIGKAEDNTDYRIKNNITVSRKHCKIMRKGDEFYIEDLGSKNGTYVDGSKLEKNDPMLLMDGQQILLSDEKFTFEQGD